MIKDGFSGLLLLEHLPGRAKDPSSLLPKFVVRLLDQNGVQEVLTLLGEHPVGERKPGRLELAFGQVLEELSDHTCLLLAIFSICLTADIQDDFQKLVEFDLTRIVIVDSLNQILDLLDRVD